MTRNKRRRKKGATSIVQVKPSPRLVKLAEEQAKRDADYRAALGLSDDGVLPKALGEADGHGGAQPQVGSRSRGTRALPSSRAVAPKK